jgi:hypothetical protein
VAADAEVASDQGAWRGLDQVGVGPDDDELAAGPSPPMKAVFAWPLEIVERMTLAPPIAWRASPGLPAVEST